MTGGESELKRSPVLAGRLCAAHDTGLKFHTDKKKHLQDIASSSAAAGRSMFFRFFCSLFNNIHVITDSDQYLETIPSGALLC